MRPGLQITTDVIRPGEGMRAWARVLASEMALLVVRVSLLCTRLDHHLRRLHENVHAPILDHRTSPGAPSKNGATPLPRSSLRA